MGNAQAPTGMRNQGPASPSATAEEDIDWGTDMDDELISLLEENARLRALVVQLSDLVLKNALDQK